MKISRRVIRPWLAGVVLGFFGLVQGAGAATLTGTFSPIAAGSNVDLTMAGKLDWVHWGLSTAGSFDRKGSVAPQIGNFGLVGDTSCPLCSLTAYQYSDNANGYTWLDGFPNTAVTNTTTGVWAYNYPRALGSGFQLQVPADTTVRTLQVFVGAYAAKGALTALLSDGSAPAFSSSTADTVNNLGNGPGGVFALTYAAASAGQTLTVTWQVTNVYLQGAGNVTLQAAALTAANANNPPYVMLLSPTNNTMAVEPAALQLSATAQDFDGTITNVTFYQGTNRLGQTASSPYQFNWSGVARGQYFVWASATDNSGVTSTSAPVEVFVYGSGGAQTNAVAGSPLTADLTAEGTADWTHWGYTNGATLDYKSLVTRKISDFTVLGANPVRFYGDNLTAFSWSDGTPDAAVSGTTTGVYVAGYTNGFKITAPADTNLRRLRLYLGGYAVAAQFQAYLSDLSAPAYVDYPVSTAYGNMYETYTIDYQAASAGQQLIAVYRVQTPFDPVYGNVTLQAATLEGGPAEALPALIQNVQNSGGTVSFSFNTQSNFSYVVEYTDSLSSIQWQSLQTYPGTGGTVTATDNSPSASTRFYRVQTR